MNGMSDNDTTFARRIGVLKRMTNAALMELTEIEVLINGKCSPGQGEGGELERMRLVLTNSIVEMDAELEELQRRLQVALTYAAT